MFDAVHPVFEAGFCPFGLVAGVVFRCAKGYVAGKACFIVKVVAAFKEGVSLFDECLLDCFCEMADACFRVRAPVSPVVVSFAEVRIVFFGARDVAKFSNKGSCIAVAGVVKECEVYFIGEYSFDEGVCAGC